MTEKETQDVLSEIRRVRRTQDEIALALRVDTPWIRARDHLEYGLSVLRRIPLLTRLCLFLGVCMVGASAHYRNLRLFFIGVDLLFAALLFVGGSQ